MQHTALADKTKIILSSWWGLCRHASIIMLQKVAAMVDKVAADLCFRASKVRWLLPEKYFDFAANSAATLCVPLYIIVLPYFRHFGSFVPKIG